MRFADFDKRCSQKFLKKFFFSHLQSLFFPQKRQNIQFTRAAKFCIMIKMRPGFAAQPGENLKLRILNGEFAGMGGSLVPNLQSSGITLPRVFSFLLILHPEVLEYDRSFFDPKFFHHRPY